MVIDQSKASLDGGGGGLFGKIIHHLDSKIRKILVSGIFGIKDPSYHSGP